MTSTFTILFPIQNVMPKRIIQRVQFSNQIPHDGFSSRLSKRIHPRRMPETTPAEMPSAKSVDTFGFIHI